MPSVLELIEKILAEQEKKQVLQQQQRVSQQQLVNAQTAGEAGQLEVQSKRAAFQADVKRAQQLYPEIKDPLEAVATLAAEEATQKRALDVRTSESEIAENEAQKTRHLADAERLAAMAARTPEDLAAKQRMQKLNEELKVLQVDRARNPEKYRRPLQGRKPKEPEKYKPSKSDLEYAEERLILAGAQNPSVSEIKQKAREIFADAAVGGAEAPAPGAPPSRPGPPGAAPSSTAAGGCPPGTVLARAPGKPDVCVKQK